jgi:hypothetical protein
VLLKRRHVAVIGFLRRRLFAARYLRLKTQTPRYTRSPDAIARRRPRVLAEHIALA